MRERGKAFAKEMWKVLEVCINLGNKRTDKNSEMSDKGLEAQ